MEILQKVGHFCFFIMLHPARLGGPRNSLQAESKIEKGGTMEDWVWKGPEPSLSDPKLFFPFSLYIKLLEIKQLL